MSSDRSATAARTGFTLSYQGRKLDQELESKNTGLARLKQNFGEMGALAIRFHIGHGKRVGLLQQIARDDYAANPIDKAAQGRDQEDIFAISPMASAVRKLTRLLERNAHYPLGKSKILNERAQPIAHVNTKNMRGELTLFDMIHSPLWSTGINFANNLNRNNFIYLICPEKISASEYQAATEALQHNNFECLIEDNKLKVRLPSGLLIESESLINIVITIDPNQTFQTNGFVVTADKKSAPVGWILHNFKSATKIVDPVYTENMLRIMKIAGGGFNELTKQQQVILSSGFLQNTGSGLFIQNQSFNALDIILQYLGNTFGYDPASLFPDKAMQISHARATDATKKSELTEDFLTGYLLSEMVQHLAKTQPNSTRDRLPKRFTNPFSVIATNAKAIAYAYNLKTKDGRILLVCEDEKRISPPIEPLIDCEIHGDLINPDLTNLKHISALLSTAILISEQMISEQLLRDAARFGRGHQHARALLAILEQCKPGESEKWFDHLINLTETLPANELGNALGLQFSYCDPLVAELRIILGISSIKTRFEMMKDRFGYKEMYLGDLAIKLYETDTSQGEALLQSLAKDRLLQKKLENLFYIGTVLQQLPDISVRAEYSRGVNAGLQLVIQRISPELYQRLSEQHKIEKPIRLMLDESQREHHHSISDLMNASAVCPFLGKRNVPLALPAAPIKQKPQQARLFSVKPMIVAGSAFVLATITAYTMGCRQ